MALSGIKHIYVGTELSESVWEEEATHELVHGNAFPTSPAPVERQCYYRDDLHRWFIYNNTSWVDLTPDSGKNVLINGSMRVDQRKPISPYIYTAATVPANSDDTFLLDRWILLSDGNDVVDVSQVVRTANGAYAECKLEVQTANKQFGILQILEARDSGRLLGQTASLSFKARMAAADDNTHSVKAVVLAWDGTADVVTSDVVAVWGATPTYVANWTAENTPASQTLTITEQTFRIEGIAIDTASAKNVAVFIFCDQINGVVNDAIIITDVQLEVGSVCTPFEFRPFGNEMSLCKRFYHSIGGDHLYNFTGVFGSASSTTVAAILTTFPVPMRVIPTFGYSAVAHFNISDGATGFVPTVLTTLGRGNYHDAIIVTSAGLTQWRPYFMNAANTLSARLYYSAEL